MLDTPQSPGADDDKRFQSCGNARRLIITGINVPPLIAGINVLVASGFSLAGLVISQSVLPGAGTPGRASQVFALYAAARTFPWLCLDLRRSTTTANSYFRSVATAGKLRARTATRLLYT